MKKFILIIIIILIAAAATIWYFQKPAQLPVETTGPGDFPQQIVKPEITFKKAMEPGTFENDKVSFALYYESELGVLDLGNTLEIYKKDSQLAKELAGSDFSVQLFLNQPENRYEQHIKSLENQITEGQIRKRTEYNFPESEKNLRDVKNVEFVAYPNNKTVVYFLYWKANGKKDYITIHSDSSDPKRYNEITAIINTIELKK